MSRTSPEEQITLLSAGTAVRREALHAYGLRLLDGLDWTLLVKMLRFRRLLPSLGPRILELAGDRADSGFTIAVEDAIDACRRQAALLELVSGRVTSSLAYAGVRSATLKGPRMGQTIYGEPGRRASSDVDLLVAPEQLQLAVEVVRSLDYEAPRDEVVTRNLPLLHFGLVHHRRELPSVELHWRIHWYEREFARDCLLPPTEDPEGQWRPALGVELATLLLFYARDGFIDLRLATDLSAWWDAFGAELHTESFVKLLVDYPALKRPLLAAVTAAKTVVGLPVEQIIGHTPRLGLRGLMAVRLANPNPSASQPQLYADMGLIDWLLIPRQGFGEFARRQLLLPREVPISRARHAGARRPISSLGHCTRVLGRFGLAMMRLARPSRSMSIT